MIAAACAALGVLLLFSPHDSPVPADAVARELTADQAAVPAQVTGAGSLRVGDLLDLAATTDSGPARIVARAARVLELPGDVGWSGGTGSTGSLVLLAVADDDALAVISASALGHLIPVIHHG